MDTRDSVMLCVTPPAIHGSRAPLLKGNENNTENIGAVVFVQQI